MSSIVIKIDYNVMAVYLSTTFKLQYGIHNLLTLEPSIRYVTLMQGWEGSKKVSVYDEGVDVNIMGDAILCFCFYHAYKTNYRMVKALIWDVVCYAVWSRDVDDEKRGRQRIEAFEMRVIIIKKDGKDQRISWTEQKTNEEVLKQ